MVSAMSTFSDHFSSSASSYAAHRPTYPAELLEWLSSSCANHRRAWDCGTGNGQAAVHLAHHFADVIATDASPAQLGHRGRKSGVHYGVMTAESSAIASGSVDLITVAQALHWFDLDRFYREAKRVLVPGGIICVWTYGLLSIDPAIDAHLGQFYRKEVGPYWPAERALVDRGYAGIDFPFDELVAPRFEMTADWTLGQFSGYLETWSAVAAYSREHGRSPVPRFAESIAPQWGESEERRHVRWPLELKAGRVAG